MRQQTGITLIEVLIATTIFALIMVMATGGITLSLRVQSMNEATSSAQAKLRRIDEAFTQELRSAVLGGLTNNPYVSDETSVSFILLDGGAGYQVLPHDSGNNNSFVNSSNVQVVAPVADADDLELDGAQALMVNANGQAVLFDVDNVQRVGGPGSIEFNIVHPGCNNSIDYTPNTLLFKVTTIGFSHDDVTGDLHQTIGSGAELDMAFDLTNFTITYVYETNDGTVIERATPLTDVDGAPLRTGIINGDPVTFARLGIDVAAQGRALGGRMVDRNLNSHVEFSSNPSFFVRKVESC